VGNNPVRFIDPDGREPRIYVETKGFGHAFETKGFGHAFVTVGTGDNTIVYTYGKYANNENARVIDEYNIFSKLISKITFIFVIAVTVTGITKTVDLITLKEIMRDNNPNRYDANGNLKKDYNKKIVDIRYNSLYLPDGLQFTNYWRNATL